MAKSSEQININLPPDVAKAWDVLRVGYPNTMMAMAGLAAFQLLDKSQVATLMPLLGAVYEKKAGWAEVNSWCETERGRRAAAEVTAAAQAHREGKKPRRQQRREGA